MPAWCEDRIAREEMLARREIAPVLRKGLLDADTPLLFPMSRGRGSLWQEASFEQIFAQASRAEE